MCTSFSFSFFFSLFRNMIMSFITWKGLSLLWTWTTVCKLISWDWRKGEDLHKNNISVIVCEWRERYFAPLFFCAWTGAPFLSSLCEHVSVGVVKLRSLALSLLSLLEVSFLENQFSCCMQCVPKTFSKKLLKAITNRWGRREWW